MAFKPKAVRPSSQELLATVGRLAADSGQLPTVAPPDRSAPAETGHDAKRSPGPTVLVNFKATLPFAKIIAEAAEKEGGVRRMLARMLKEAGHDVPEHDLRPAANRRVYK